MEEIRTNVSIFCSDSLHDEHNLSSLEGVDDGYSDDDSKDGNSDSLRMEPYHYELVGLSESRSAVTESGSDKDKDKADCRLGNISWYGLVANRVRSD